MSKQRRKPRRNTRQRQQDAAERWQAKAELKAEEKSFEREVMRWLQEGAEEGAQDPDVLAQVVEACRGTSLESLTNELPQLARGDDLDGNVHNVEQWLGRYESALGQLLAELSHLEATGQLDIDLPDDGDPDGHEEEAASLA